MRVVLDRADIRRLVRDPRHFDAAYVEAWLDAIERRAGEPLRARWDGIRRGE